MQIIFNLEAKLKAAILLGFSFLLYWLIDSGTITVYINPRFVGITKATSIVMFLMFIVQFFRTTPRVHFTHDHCNSVIGIKWGYIAFIIPLLMAYLLPHSALDANMSANKRITLNTKSVTNNQPGALTPGKNEPTEQTGVSNANTPESNELKQASLLKVTDENFNYVVSKIYLFPEDYIGKEISILGFVDKDDSFLPNQFGLARYLITCCSADATLTGLICEYNDATSFKKGTWLTIRGTIEEGLYDQRTVPVVKVISYQNSENPKNPYIYP